MSRSSVDDSQWPIVVVTLPRTPLDDEGFEDHCKQTFRYFERGQSFAWVIDVRNAAQLSASQRRIIAEKTDECRARHPKVACASAVIVSSAIQRGVTKAILWLLKQPIPTEVFSTPEQGVRWARSYLASIRSTATHQASP
jgi:hypothetical protein